MLLLSLRRRRPLRRLRACCTFCSQPIVVVLLCVVLIDALVALQARPSKEAIESSGIASWSSRSATARTWSHGPEQAAAASAAKNTTVFIASIHRNTEAILREAWNEAVVDLVRQLGVENVFFSAVEGGSQDDTKKALADLGMTLDRMGVPNTIKLGMTMWEQLDALEMRPDPASETKRRGGWIWNEADGRLDMRRIPYLAGVRNEAMEPLGVVARGGEGRRFDRVLWLNDVVFDTDDVLTLLATRNGHYAAACSMDFKTYPSYYDTFALRDDLGLKTVSEYAWPWFASPAARAAIRHGRPARVFSCWNGIVIFDARPFYDADPPLRFRGIDDSLADMHLEASECCLVHADNPLSFPSSSADVDGGAGHGVWLNPNVRVGYSVAAYRKVKSRPDQKFPEPVVTVAGLWVDRWKRLKLPAQIALEKRTVRQRLQRWKAAVGKDEIGEPCLINEMQIMWLNGWRHL